MTSKEAPTVLCVIPARGGSRGVPRKNVRPVCGYPLIHYVIDVAKHCPTITDIAVTSENEEIIAYAQQQNVIAIQRPPYLSADGVTLDPVIEHAVRMMIKRWRNYDYVVTLQPTSPLVSPQDISTVIRMNNGCDCVVSVKPNRHALWQVNENRDATPLRKERVNRQQTQPYYEENGAIISCKTKFLEQEHTRVGGTVSLYSFEDRDSIDIDSLTDFHTFEGILRRRKILFAVIGNNKVGMGHVYRSLSIADELVNHDICFLVSVDDGLARGLLDKSNYPTLEVERAQWLEVITAHKPDIVINDILNTSDSYITALRRMGVSVINFEDIGEGNKYANVVINALYAPRDPGFHSNMYFGPHYFFLRNEFYQKEPRKTQSPTVQHVLIAFGGADPNNLTTRVLKVISDGCRSNGITIDVVTGLGYQWSDDLLNTANRLGVHIKITQSTSRISDFMNKADIAFTSGGRTVFELASLATPIIVLCQNENEILHTYASSTNGIWNLGLASEVTVDEINRAFLEMVADRELRDLMAKQASRVDFRAGKGRVLDIINQVIRGHKRCN